MSRRIPESDRYIAESKARVHYHAHPELYGDTLGAREHKRYMAERMKETGDSWIDAINREHEPSDWPFFLNDNDSKPDYSLLDREESGAIALVIVLLIILFPVLLLCGASWLEILGIYAIFALMPIVMLLI